ncbi:hypothetical protein SAMN04487776_11830 [Priestia megaterium]|nr:hypothetical protein SAMN04487776_11830 [Priestia megaterium]
MQADMTVEEIKAQIQYLETNGQSLKKKQVKQTHPKLMKNALYFFPSWERAMVESGVNTI